MKNTPLKSYPRCVFQKHMFFARILQIFFPEKLVFFQCFQCFLGLASVEFLDQSSRHQKDKLDQLCRFCLEIISRPAYFMMSFTIFIAFSLTSEIDTDIISSS